MKRFRKEKYNTGYHSFGAVNKDASANLLTEQITLGTVASIDSTAYDDFGIVKDGNGDDPTVDLLLSGQPLEWGSTFGILMNDGCTGDLALVCIYGRRLSLMTDPADAANIAKGKPAYIWPLATATVGGMLTTDSDTGANARVGTFLGTKTDDPAGRPAGDYAEVLWNPIAF